MLQYHRLNWDLPKEFKKEKKNKIKGQIQLRFIISLMC